MLLTSKSKGVMNAAQMKAPVCRLKLPHLDNDLSLPHDCSSFIKSLLWREGSAGLWMRDPQKVIEGWEDGMNVRELE